MPVMIDRSRTGGPGDKPGNEDAKKKAAKAAPATAAPASAGAKAAAPKLEITTPKPPKAVLRAKLEADDKRKQMIATIILSIITVAALALVAVYFFGGRKEPAPENNLVDNPRANRSASSSANAPSQRSPAPTSPLHNRALPGANLGEGQPDRPAGENGIR